MIRLRLPCLGNDLTAQDTSANPARYYLVLPAAGSGQRMQAAIPKQYLEIDGTSLLQLTLERLGSMPWFARIVVVLAPDDVRWPEVVARLAPGIRDKLLIAPGGSERYRSVHNALEVLAAFAMPGDWILVHDAVRPCVQASDVALLIDSLQEESAGGLLAVPVRDTLKESQGGDGSDARLVKHTVDRSALWLASTPQMFRFAVLQAALQEALQDGRNATDEAAAVEALGLPVRLIRGRADNLKVTYPEDLALVAALLRAGNGTQASDVVDAVNVER